MQDFLQLADRRIAVLGVANRKRDAWHVAQVLKEACAELLYVVRSPERQASIAKLVGEAPIYVCDVEHQDQIDRLAQQLKADFDGIHGLVHSIAFAAYDDGGVRPFHETTREQLLRTFDVSCFSLI